MYALGDGKYGELFPDQKDRGKWLTWGRFKEVHFRRLLATPDRGSGAWEQGDIGPVYGTSLNLCLLQLDKGLLPIYQR